MQDNYEMKMVLGYVKSILKNKRMAHSNIDNLANFIDSMIPMLNLSAKHNKLLEIIDESIGWKENRFYPKNKIMAIKNAISKIIYEHELSCSVENIGELDSRINEFSAVLGLDKDETDFLGFLIRYQCHDQLNQLINDIANNSFGMKEIYTTCLNTTKDNLMKLLTNHERLLASGAVEYDGSVGKNFSDCFSVPNIIVAAMQRANTSGDDILQFIIGLPEKATLHWQDFDHIANSIDRLLPFLKNSLTQREPGINVLLYGPPGTGKTEFCKTLANRLGVDLYSLTEQSQYGDEPSRSDRLSGYLIAQNLLKKRGDCILLFDEMDDLFSSHLVLSYFNIKASSGSKIFMNRILEDNHIPTIWTINDPQLLDETIIRRMSISIEMKKPDFKTLQKLWEKQLKENGIDVPEEEIEKLAQSGASPAVVDSAVKFSKLSNGNAGDCMFATQNILKAIDGKCPVSIKRAEDFKYELVVANNDLKELANKITNNSNKGCSFCLYGPPGTGKSLYARHLAKCMNMPVLFKRTSDLLSMWVGGSEKNIASAFSEAIESNSFLIFDEADSLLSDRSRARASWEVTQVNEMLTWMEQHPLPFVCTTNLINSLDQASMRRFTFKVHFEYLNEIAISAAFEFFFDMKISAQIAKSLSFVTPGDFAVVKKKINFLGSKFAVSDIVDMLDEEIKTKNEVFPINIGFQP